MNWIGYCLLGGIWVGLVMIYIKLTDIEFEVEYLRRRFDKIIGEVIDALKNKEE